MVVLDLVVGLISSDKSYRQLCVSQNRNRAYKPVAPQATGTLLAPFHFCGRPSFECKIVLVKEVLLVWLAGMVAEGIYVRVKIDISSIFRIAIDKTWWIRERSKRNNQRLTSLWTDHTLFSVALAVLGLTYEWLSRQKHLKDDFNLLCGGARKWTALEISSTCWKTFEFTWPIE